MPITAKPGEALHTEHAMNGPMTLDEFYCQTMEANGIVREPEPIEKVAEAQGVDVVVAKLAKAIYDQSRIDDVKYASAKDRLEDSFKVAKAYVAYMDETKTAATKLAGDLARVAAYAIEGYLAQHGISEITAADGVKVAAVCVEEAQQKIAEPGSDFVMKMIAARKGEKGEEKDDEKKDEKKKEDDKEPAK